MDDLGSQEKAVLAAIAANPLVGQQEIATALGLARSTVAAHIAQLVRRGYVLGRGYMLPARRRIVCFGGATVDRKYRSPAALAPRTSNPVSSVRSFGGVARNVAENLARLGVDVSLVTLLGDDENGRAILAHLRATGVETGHVFTTPERPTAEYVAVLESGSDLVFGLADMGILDLVSEAHLDRAWPLLASAEWVFVDCNLPAPVLAALIQRRRGARFRLAVDTVSTSKAARLPADLAGVDLLVLNLDEALARLGASRRMTADAAARALREQGARSVILTRGAQGLVVADAGGLTPLPPAPSSPVDVTGAGDALIAGALLRLLAGDELLRAARTGALLAALTTESAASVHPDLSPRWLEAASHRLSKSLIPQESAHAKRPAALRARR